MFLLTRYCKNADKESYNQPITNCNKGVLLLLNLLTNDVNELAKAFDLNESEKYIVANLLDKIKACKALKLTYIASYYEESLSEFLRSKE